MKLFSFAEMNPAQVIFLKEAPGHCRSLNWFRGKYNESLPTKWIAKTCAVIDYLDARQPRVPLQAGAD